MGGGGKKKEFFILISIGKGNIAGKNTAHFTSWITSAEI